MSKQNNLNLNLERRISSRIFEKIWNGPIGTLRGLGETHSWKKPSRKSHDTVPLIHFFSVQTKLWFRRRRRALPATLARRQKSRRKRMVVTWCSLCFLCSHILLNPRYSSFYMTFLCGLNLITLFFVYVLIALCYCKKRCFNLSVLNRQIKDRKSFYRPFHFKFPSNKQ